MQVCPSFLTLCLLQQQYAVAAAAAAAGIYPPHIRTILNKKESQKEKGQGPVARLVHKAQGYGFFLLSHPVWLFLVRLNFVAQLYSASHPL